MGGRVPGGWWVLHAALSVAAVGFVRVGERAGEDVDAVEGLAMVLGDGERSDVLRRVGTVRGIVAEAMHAVESKRRVVTRLLTMERSTALEKVDAGMLKRLGEQLVRGGMCWADGEGGVD
jgi:Mg2+ and Co2+ transporter CorA